MRALLTSGNYLTPVLVIDLSTLVFRYLESAKIPLMRSPLTPHAYIPTNLASYTGYFGRPKSRRVKSFANLRSGSCCSTRVMNVVKLP
jgi:hypothetical protein